VQPLETVGEPHVGRAQLVARDAREVGLHDLAQEGLLHELGVRLAVPPRVGRLDQVVQQRLVLLVQRGGDGERPSKVLEVCKREGGHVLDELACTGGGAAKDGEADEVEKRVLRRREAVGDQVLERDCVQGCEERRERQPLLECASCHLGAEGHGRVRQLRRVLPMHAANRAGAAREVLRREAAAAREHCHTARRRGGCLLAAGLLARRRSDHGT
jgi:hypothetical protein